MTYNVNHRLAVVALALFANAYAMSNPFPYTPFMVLHFGMVDDEREAGFYAGYIMSSFMVGRVISSYPLGILSDTWGRRPVVELGLWSCVIFQVGFGAAPTFAFALAMRFLMGAFNAILGVTKAWLPDIAPADKQPLAMSLIAGTWGLGQVVGPSLGGLLTAASESALLPYVWPNVLGAILAVISVLAIRTMMPADGSAANIDPKEAPTCGLASADSAAERDQAEQNIAAEHSAAKELSPHQHGGVSGGGVSGGGVRPDGVRPDGVTADGVTPGRMSAGGVSHGVVTPVGCLSTLFSGVPDSSAFPLGIYCAHSFTAIAYAGTRSPCGMQQVACSKWHAAGGMQQVGCSRWDAAGAAGGM